MTLLQPVKIMYRFANASGVPLLQRDRQPLVWKRGFACIASSAWNATTYTVEKLLCLSVPNSSDLASEWNEKISSGQLVVFCCLFHCRKFSSRTRRERGVFDVRRSERVGNGDVPSNNLATLSRNDRSAVGSLSVLAETSWFLDSLNHSPLSDKRHHWWCYGGPVC